MNISENISTDTIIRTIVLMIALLNQALTSLGKNPIPFADEVIYEGVSLLVTFAAAAWTWWKNNSVTPEAVEADRYLAELRAKKKEEDQNGCED
jgi:SPP1 family holin